MKNKMHGFKTVFSHNLGIHMKSKKYLAVTIILAVFLLAGISIFIMIMSDKNSRKDQYTYNVDKVYVVDETGLGVPDYSMYGAALGYEDAADTEFVTSDKSPEELVDTDGAQYVVVQKKSGDSFVLCVIFGNTDNVTDEQVDFNTAAMEEYLVPCFKTHLFQVSGLTGEQIVQVMLQICADVPMEKTSKLVEQIMMSVTPYALVSGKILAMVFASVIQFIIWIGCIVGGVLLGDVLSKTVLGVDTSAVTTAVVQSIFIIPLVAAFMLVLFASGLTASGNYNIPLAYNLVPFSAAMTAPASVLIGTLSVPMAIVSLIISVVSGMIILYVAARLYKGMMFFNGKKAKLKDFISAIKG